jgi:hypothetical protein
VARVDGASGDKVPARYRSDDEDSTRWRDFTFRSGDVVVSSRSKHGTTWVQHICAMLLLGTARLPAPLAELSPWLDWLVEPADEVFARLAAQPHRRVVKTHTPLDGVPADPRVTYVVVARHPLDAAVSLYHQGANIDRTRLRELTGAPPTPTRPRPSLPDWLAAWIDADPDPRERLDSLPGVLWHLTDAWGRRDEPNVVLLHYHDLSTDLSGQMRRLADRLHVSPPAADWPDLVAAATFDRMRADADQLAPDRAGVLASRAAFFRGGRSGAGRAALDPDALARYQARSAALAPADLLAWLHRPE